MLGQIGSFEILIVIIVILVVLGPKQIPVVMRSIGKLYRELNIMKNSLMNQIDDLDREEDIKPEKKNDTEESIDTVDTSPYDEE